MEPSSHLHAPHAEEEKFVIDAAENVEASLPLPEGYGENILVALARDPFWFFTYWELTPERTGEVNQRFGGNLWDHAALVLRAYDVTDRPGTDVDSSPFFDTEVSHKQARQWYVHTPQSGRAYIIDLGLRLPDGRFYSLLRSNRIQLPAGRVSDKTDSQWMGRVADREAWDELIARGVDQIGQGSAGSAELAKSMAHRWDFLKSVYSGSLPSSMPSGASVATEKK